MNILFISYYFHPSDLVGAKRISYWAKNISKYHKNKISVSLITTESEAKLSNPEIDNIYIVEKKQKSFFRIDNGSDWILDLKPFLKDHLKTNHYKYCVITGNPFGHFFLIKELKKHRIKPLLDFRDPFANNPRLKKSIKSRIKENIFSIIELYLISTAFKSVVVNKYCLELIRYRNLVKHKIYIIDNGYDEIILNKIDLTKKRITKNKGIALAYSGSIYADRNPLNLIQILHSYSGSISLHLIGKNYLNFRSDYVHEHGILPYEENLLMLNNFDILVILATGHKFESSTKVFDYIGMKKPILVIFNDWYGKGSLHEILKNYPKVAFAQNNKSDIKQALDKLIFELNFNSIEFNNFNTDAFSRRAGLEKLIQLMNEN